MLAVVSFPRSASLIQKLACNDATASEVQLLCQAKFSESARQRNVAGKYLTERLVRDAFENLIRSIDTLGRRVGVGEDWVDVGKEKVALWKRLLCKVSNHYADFGYAHNIFINEDTGYAYVVGANRVVTLAY